MTTLPRAYMQLVTNLHEAGGSGALDSHGRVVVGTPPHPIPGDTLGWLICVAAGLVAGDSGRLILTEEGRATAAGVIAGRSREA
jgi:hypothetical protein